MDGLSAAASVIAVVQISEEVFKLCRTYYLEVKEARKDIQRLRDEVTSLQDVLTNVADMAEDPDSASLSIFSLLNQQDGPVEQCQRDLVGLVTKLDPGQGKNKMKQFGLRALKWPFSSKDVEKLLTTIGRHKATFSLALAADHVGLSRAIKDDMARLNDGVAELQIGQRTFFKDERRQKIHQWLSPPDPSSNHNAALKKRQPLTGEWFLRSSQFEEWKVSSNSFLWLHGIPGCGKTVLCSTIVQDVTMHYKSDPEVAVAYFYFDFNEFEKRRHENLIRSLIVQFSTQSVKALESLDGLFARCQDGQQRPTTDALKLTLEYMLRDFQQTFIILDALDECEEREELLGLIENVVEWKLEKLHIITTSRREREIEDSLKPLITDQICIHGALINADIHTHICERLRNDPKLRNWPANVQVEIEKTLMDGANGMFRWVVCQLDVLRNCLKPSAIRKALRSLPKTLDDTYAQILCSIDEEYSQDALKILEWLVYSARPLRIEEVAEVVAVDIGKNPRFDPQSRLREPRDILTICSSLVTIATSMAQNDDDEEEGTHEIEELRLAHFSVKEYLISDRIRTGPASQYTIERCAEGNIAQTCLVYLLYFNGPTLLTQDNVDEFQLARYAAEYWLQHARAAEKGIEKINQLALDLFQVKCEAYTAWYRLCALDRRWRNVNMSRSLENLASPLYYAALGGLDKLARVLIDKGADVNAKGGFYGHALEAASVQNYKIVVKLLIEEGADINAQGGWYNNALQAASYEGNEAIVKLLLENGADVNAKGGKEYSSALQAALVKGNEAIVKLLLENGADVNAKGEGYYGSALEIASATGNEAVVKQLLENGANVNAKGGEEYGSALQAASVKGNEAIVKLLLENKVDVNAKGGRYGNAVQAASAIGNEAIVKLLLENGADANAKGGFFSNALEAASARGNKAIVKLLLKNGADVNAKGEEYYGSALQAASASGNEAIVKLLLENGADVNAKSGLFGSALQAASAYGNKAIVKQLLENGASINAKGGEYGNALQAASATAHEAIVKLLLENGADVNAIGEKKYGSALQAALAGGNEAIVKLLLKNKADVNAQGGRIYGNALQAASVIGNEAIVKLLLENGVNVNAKGGRRYGSALQAASVGGNEVIVKLLLENRADVNAKGGRKYSNALQAASAYGNEAIVKLLLENGADVNAKGGKYGNALQAALEKGHDSIVKLLRDNGAIDSRNNRLPTTTPGPSIV